MSWNNRVVVNEHTYPDGTTECTAQIHEVYYTDGKVGSTENPIAAMGVADTEQAAIIALKRSLLLQLEAVNFVIDGSTSVYDYNNKKSHAPGKKSEVLKTLDEDSKY